MQSPGRTGAMAFGVAGIEFQGLSLHGKGGFRVGTRRPFNYPGKTAENAN